MCLVFAMVPAAAFAGTETQDLEVSADKNGRYTYKEGKVKITSGGSYSISMAENVKTTTDSIEIGEGLEVYLSLYRVSIDLSSKGVEGEKEDGKYVALKIGKNAKVTIDINFDNTLKSGRASAGIELADSAELTFESFIGSASTLTVAGGGSGAGIGGPIGSKGGKVTIEDGTINATGGNIGGAGIDAREVIINDGIVYATGGDLGGAGIGGSSATRDGGSSENRNGGIVTINNGEVTAMGKGGGAGIGGAFFGDGGIVNINGGFVTARGGSDEYLGGAGIGSGNAFEVQEPHSEHGKGNGGTVNINGGTVVAEGGKGCVGIGGSLKGADVTIKGGSVTATGGRYSKETQIADGIGAGPRGDKPGTLTIVPQGSSYIVNVGAGSSVAPPINGSPFETQEEIISQVKGNPYFSCRQSLLTVTGGQEGRDYKFEDDVLRIYNGGAYVVSMANNAVATQERIRVTASAAVTLTLENVNISCSSGTDIAALEINGPEKVTLELRGKNKLNSGAGCAGIELKNNATLVITSSSGGQLDTHGGYIGAGIGGINNTAGAGTEQSVNKVVIAGGIINAAGGSGGAGIGGSIGCDGCDVTVTGGILNATGKGGAAGIGGGIGGNGGSFTITGGKVNAIGSTAAAGIGGGLYTADDQIYTGGNGGTVVIKGGELTAIGKSCAIGTGAESFTQKGVVKSPGTITISPAGAGINAWAGSSETENKALEGSTFFASADITDLIKDKTYFYSREYVPYVPPAEDDVKTTPDGTTSTTVKDIRTETVKNEQGEEISKVTATVSEKVAEKLVDQAVSNKSDTVEITVKSNDGNKAEQTEVEIPKKAVESIAKDTNADLVIKTDSGQVTLDNRTLETIAAEAEGDTVKIIVNENTQLKEEQKPASDVIGKNGKLFDLKAVIGDKILHDFRGGKAHVTLPVPEKLKGKDIVIIYINDKGICEILNHTMETVGAEKYIKFTTSHFSNFAVVEKADAEKLIAKQNADKINSLTKEAKLKATTSKTAKKSIKVKIGEAKNSNSLIKEAKAMGYTVKYKFYKSTKKASKYKAVKTKTSNSYINTKGKKGTRYYYKAKVMVYDGKTLIAQTELKQCSYGARTWSK